MKLFCGILASFAEEARKNIPFGSPSVDGPRPYIYTVLPSMGGLLTWKHCNHIYFLTVLQAG